MTSGPSCGTIVVAVNWKRWIIGKWDWKRPLRSLVLIYGVVAVVACSFTNKFIFHPPHPQYEADHDNVLLLDKGESRVACLYFPPADGQPVLLWAHGNAEDIGGLEPVLAMIHRRGFGVLAYDYPGYGHSAGSPSESSCYDAASRAFRFLREHEGVEPARILLLGQSIGSGPACWLAEREETGGLILISPVLSAFRTLTRIPILPGDIFNNLKRIRHIDEPLLVIHGTRDEAVPFSHGQRLHHEHPGPKRFLEIPGAGHNDIWLKGGEDIARAIEEFAKLPRAR